MTERPVAVEVETGARLVAARVDATTAVPLHHICPVCDAPINGACTIWEAPQPGDVRGLSLVRAQVADFHQARVDLGVEHA